MKTASLVVYILVTLIAVADLTDAQVADLSQRRGITGRIGYALDCAGRYVRVSLSTGDLTGPNPIPGVPPGTGSFDGCLFQGFAKDQRRPILYVAVAKQRLLDSSGKGQDRMVALDLSTMRELSSIDIPLTTDRQPTLRTDSRADELFVSYFLSEDDSAPDKSIQFRISTENPERLEVLKSPGTLDSALRSSRLVLTSGAYVHSSGRIIDGDRTVSRDGHVSVVDGYSLLTEALRMRFQSLMRVSTTGKRYLDVVFADSARGRMAFITGWDTASNRSNAGGGILVYDAINQKILTAITTPYREAAFELTPDTPTVHLAPNGEFVVVEEYQWKQLRNTDGALGVQRYKTGKIAIYDANSGTFVRALQLQPPPGSYGKILGFTSDSDFVCYTSKETLYLGDLSTGQVSAVKLPSGFFPTAFVAEDR